MSRSPMYWVNVIIGVIVAAILLVILLKLVGVI